MGWGYSTRRGGGRKLRARPRKFVFLGFRREETGMSREFCRDSAKKKAHKHKLFGPVALGTPGMSPGQTGFVPGTKWVCPRDKPRFSSCFTQRKPSLSLEQTQLNFVPGTFRGRRAADRAYVLKVYVPFSFPRDVPDPWGCSKVCAKNFVRIFRSLFCPLPLSYC